MSRIHEALKKAEEERAASQGGPSQPSFAAAAAEPPMTAAAEGTTAAAMPTVGVPLGSGSALPAAAVDPRSEDDAIFQRRR